MNKNTLQHEESPCVFSVALHYKKVSGALLPDHIATGKSARSTARDTWRSIESGGIFSRHLFFAAMVFLAANHCSPLYSQSSVRKETGWLEFEHCPVFVIDSLDVPAQENGVIAKLETQVNQDIEANQLLGTLDQSAALLEESLSAKQAQVAVAAAMDDSDLKFAQLLVEEATIALDSYEQINSRGSATDAEMRAKRLSVTQAELKVQHARQTTEQLKLKARLAQASVIAASERVNRLKFIAPFSGSISEIFRHQGEWVQSGQPIVRLIRLDELRVDVYVPIQSIDVASLVNAPVLVTARRAGMDTATFSGRVTHYDPSVSSTGDVRIHATIQNQRVNGHWLLLPGMTASMKIQPPTSPHSASLLRRHNERR